MKTNLLGRSRQEIGELIRPLVDRRFRSDQIANWILQRHATSFDEMSNLPLSLRTDLANSFCLLDPCVVEQRSSEDGATKYLFELEDGAKVEGVSIPEDRKLTLCLSSQTGCALGCKFCVTGALGGGRNLKSSELVGQYRSMLRSSANDVERVNIVFMGMGEPLLNTTQLLSALEALYERVSPRRITVSTAGVIPGIESLAKMERRPKLAVSLNAPDQARRERIMPIAKTYSLSDLFAALRGFPLERGRRLTFEYVLLAGFNDSPEDASALGKLVQDFPSKINVIPFNEDRHHIPELRQPPKERILAFTERLRSKGLTATVRWSRGEDVSAACGQLKGRETHSRTTIDS
ncbi:MAG: 23S rRNA (adenine(2503)-C(2))-methyltransferase RlmN [bacterium]|nr:23S rRNA (adenine(2503)-C(2))-methyltransferase RlmN [bacterium]